MDPKETHLWTSLQKLDETETLIQRLTTNNNLYILSQNHSDKPEEYDDEIYCANYSVKAMGIHHEKAIAAAIKELESELDTRYRKRNPDPWSEVTNDTAIDSFLLPPKPSIVVGADVVIKVDSDYFMGKILYINYNIFIIIIIFFDFLYLYTCNVMDADDSVPEEQRETFHVPLSDVFTLYTYTGISNKIAYPIGYPVLAMFPDTTAYYPGIITTSKTPKKDTYAVQFEDDMQGNERILYRDVPCKFVIPKQMNKPS
ncbi:hypothetical protein WA158_008461 [Blastocystis sp. Blastoise]